MYQERGSLYKTHKVHEGHLACKQKSGEGAVGSDVSCKGNVFGGEMQEGLRRCWSVGEKRVFVTAGKRDLPNPLETSILSSPLNGGCNLWHSFWSEPFNAPQPIPRCRSGVNTDQELFSRGNLDGAT